MTSQTFDGVKRELIEKAYEEIMSWDSVWHSPVAKELRALLDAPAENVIDVSAASWDEIQKAASESTWMPPEYMRNDWVDDVCRFLRDGPTAHPQGEPVKVAFSALSYGAKFKYELEHGQDKVYVKIGHDLVAAWDERLASSSWRAQGIFSFAGGDSALSDEVYLVSDADLSTAQAQVIEQQRQLIISLRKELVESYSIGAIRPPEAPKSECPSCLGDRALRCDACIPDFSPGSGNKARRRVEAIEKGCPQPQAHPARCGCKDGNE